MLSRRGRIAAPYVAVDRPYSLDADDIPNRLRSLIRWPDVEDFLDHGLGGGRTGRGDQGHLA